ncbi:MAG: DUF1838 family protein [Pseudomonadota bacterium]
MNPQTAKQPLPFGRLLGAAVATAALLAALPAQARTLDPDKPADAVEISRKVACSTVDGAPVTFWWDGRAFSRRQGEKDKVLFRVEGMNTRACVKDTHPERGDGFKLVSRELLLYRDIETNEVLKTWTNPWTGEELEVMHVANDPVNFAMYEKNRDGSPFSWSGKMHEGQWRQTNTVPLWYPNPLGSKYQAEVGGTYHATEMFNFMGSKKELLNSRTKTAGVHVGWVRMSDWLPWMKMNGRDGVIYMHTAGLKVSSWGAMPDTMKDEITKHYPEYRNPPPLDDDRRNVTSWSYYRDVSEGKVELPKR